MTLQKFSMCYLLSNEYGKKEYRSTYTVKDKGGKPDRKPHPLTRNPYRNLKFGNSEDYAQ
jgi:hypothetical protein